MEKLPFLQAIYLQCTIYKDERKDFFALQFMRWTKSECIFLQCQSGYRVYDLGGVNPN